MANYDYSCLKKDGIVTICGSIGMSEDTLKNSTPGALAATIRDMIDRGMIGAYDTNPDVKPLEHDETITICEHVDISANALRTTVPIALVEALENTQHMIDVEAKKVEHNKKHGVSMSERTLKYGQHNAVDPVTRKPIPSSAKNRIVRG